MKKIVAKIFAKYINWKSKSWINNPIRAQDKIFKSLINNAVKTRFGKDHDFYSIINYDDYKSSVSIND